jgi:hypothetical protein
MKHTHKAVLTRPWAVNLARNGSGTRCLWTVLPFAVCAALMQCLTSVQADDALAVKGPDTQPPPVQAPVYIPQGRQMKRYAAFARQAELPSITITSNSVLQVGGVLIADTPRLTQLSTREKVALAGQLSVPVGVINNLVRRLASSPSETADQLAQEIRAAVIDYRFLHIEWERYHPPAEGQKTKAAALEALQAGDITKAWELYDGLRRPPAPAIAAPAPPANLRVVAQP